jgi:hypothetical protein
MIPKPIVEHFFQNEWTLLCPNCGDTYLHHDKVEVFNRLQEDEESGLHVLVQNQNHASDSSMEENPSSRRDGLFVRFWCENCDAISKLTIRQHKGITFLKFDFFIKQKSHKETYHEYLESPEWDERRKAKLDEAGYRCQLCNKASKLSVHHRCYDRVFNELPEDLIALCKKCHQKFHDIGEA